MHTKGQPAVEWWRDGRRRCSGCLGYFEPVAFAERANGGQTGDGLDIYCRECRKAAGKRHYRRYRARHIAETQAWRVAHPDAYRARQRQYMRERRAAEKLLALLDDESEWSA